jgi:hypothetical protein
VSIISRARKPLTKYGGIGKFPQLACAVLAATFIFGTIPALAILAESPSAVATPLYAKEPPQPPQLSDEEREALDAKKSGKSLTEAQKDAAIRAEKKQETAEKYQGKRNQQKRDNNWRRGGRRR